jgi:hypothetical protein
MPLHVGPTCKEWLFWTFHISMHAGAGELACHVSQSGKNVTNLQRMWRICSSISKCGI